MSAYYYLAKMKILVSLAYRFEVFINLGTNLILMVASTFLWRAAYKGVDTVAGVNESQMITYAMVSILITSFYNINVQYTLYRRIRQGDIAIDFFRPIKLLLCYFAEDIGQSISSVVNKLLPLLVIMSAFIQIPAPAGFTAGLLFVLSTAMSFVILWLISALIGVLCFWFVELGNIDIIKDGILFLLSGRIIPLWLFPENIQNILKFLPFQYIYQTPLSIFIGQLPLEQAGFTLLIQFTWIVILMLLLCFAWSKARKHISIQGG